MIRTLAAALVTTTCVVALATPAAAQTRDYKVPAGTLRSALDAFARQSGRQVIYRGDEVRSARSPGVRGARTAENALEALLANTGFAAKRDASGAFAVAKLGNGQAVAGDSASSLGGDAPSQDHDSDDGTIVVTGSRLARVGDGPTPVSVFNRSRIQETGATNVADVLNYFPQQSYGGLEQNNTGAGRFANLRGLGLGSTLVLINGRRTVTSAAVAAGNVLDLNTIPLAAVDRVEVLADSASAVYGADAVGGVINIVLRDVHRPQFDGYYGTAKDGGAETRASLALGHRFGPLKVSVVLDLFDRNFLSGADRALTADQDFRRFGGTDNRSTTSNPGNVYTLDGSNLPGLNSAFAAIPVGNTGIGLTPSDFAATAGIQNRESLYRFTSIIPQTRRYGVTSQASYDLSNEVTAFAELLYSDNTDVRRNSPPAAFGAVVPASNPFNPFGVDVAVDYLFAVDRPLFDRSTSKSTRAVVGLKGNGRSIDWELSALSFNDHATDRNDSIFVDSAKIAAALADPNPATAFNIFADGPGGSPAVVSSFLLPPTNDQFKSSAAQLSGFIRARVLELPGGTLQVLAGGEARREKIGFGLRSVGLDFPAKRTSEAAFAEVSAPLVGPDMHVPLVRSLTLTGAARYDHYSDFGSTFNPQVGLQWELASALMLRGSYGTSFRPPSLFQLYQPAISFPSIAVDPRRNNEVVPVTYSIGGNAELRPEESTSSSVGVVFRPATAIRLEGTYWHIKQKSRFQASPAGLILANEQLFPDRFTRAEPTPADTAAGVPGVLQAVDLSPLNFGRLTADGIDLTVSGRIPAWEGIVDYNVSGTRVLTFDSVDFPNTPEASRLGLASPGPAGTVPKLRVVSNVGYEIGPFRASATARYRSGYDDADVGGVPNGREIDAQTLVDIQVTIDLGKIAGSAFRPLVGAKLSLGAINLFDADVPFSEVGGALGYDSSQADLRGRFLYASISKTF